jgi:phenylacetate-CoA ligase
MHLLDDLVYVEFLDPQGRPLPERRLGNVIVTSLTNYAMPLLRYEHGDLGWYTDEPCGCGRTSRRIDIEGRLQALVLSPDGRPIPTSAWMDALIPDPGVALFKVNQLDVSRFEVELLQDPDRPLDQPAILGRLRDVLWDGCEVTLKPTRRIQPSPSGKFRLVASTSHEDFRCVAPERRPAPLGEYW